MKKGIKLLLIILCILCIHPSLLASAKNTPGESKYKIAEGKKEQISNIISMDASWKHLTYKSKNTKIIKVNKTGKLTAENTGKTHVYIYADGQLVHKIAITVNLANPTGLQIRGVSEGDATIKVSWKKVSHADHYIVYRQVDSNSWRKIDTTKNTFYKDRSTKNAKNHSYKIVAATKKNANYNSDYSSVIALTIPQKPYGCMISSITDKGICYYWKKPGDGDGFDVYRSYEKDKNYVKVGTYAANQFTHLDKNFDRSKTAVYYKCRSFCLDEKGNKIYSKYSKISTAKYRDDLLLEKPKIYMRKDAKRKIGAFYGWGNATGAMWSSFNEAVATVDSNGVITAKSKGTATISVTTADWQHTKQCTVVVEREAQAPLHLRSSRFTQSKQGHWKGKKSSTKTANIMMVGDMMCTGTQQAVQGFETGDYNFEDSYDYVRNIIKKSDLAVGNLETVLSPSWPYMHEEGYMNNRANCNAPNRYLEAVKNAGFDGVILANNHNADAEIRGIKDTVNFAEEYGMPHTGAFTSADDTRYMLIEVNGIKVGYIAYVAPETGYNHKDESWSKQQKDTYLNYYSYDTAKKDFDALKTAGAEYVIVYMHWGLKNSSVIKPHMQKYSKELANIGVDYIVGSHSHLLQPYTRIVSDSGKEVPCFYSLGDFQSSIEQIKGNRDSAILSINIKKNSDGSVILVDEGYIPCYNLTEYNGKQYPVIPVDYKTSDSALKQQLQEAKERIMKAVGDRISPIPYK